MAAPDNLIADFNGNSFDGWIVTGTAFGSGPVGTTLPNQHLVSGFHGKYVSSYHGTDQAQGTLTSPAFKISCNNISFLIGGGTQPETARINLLVDNKIVDTATGLNDEHLDWYTWDTKALIGKTAQIQIVDHEQGGWGHIMVDQIIQTDKPPVQAMSSIALYRETYRPQFHFTASKNWLNDPNGCVFYDGEYHLFFQHNPGGINWGNMTWGHAVSPDLVHWTQLGDAIRPDKLGTIFSGSAVVDGNNTSGFGDGQHPPLVAMYTAAGGTNPESKGQRFTQCIAYSNDKGRTWTKFDRNPVIDHIVHENRDPKLIWHEATKKWIVALYLDGERFALFSSPDFKKWTKLQELTMSGCSECPDFFPLNVDGDASKTKWVFTNANGRYLLGDFDGTRFTTDSQVHQVDYGNSDYAVQTYSDIPAIDGRRIQIGWMRDGKYPRMPFNQQMSFPSELKLKNTSEGPRIFKIPIKEIELLHGDKTQIDATIKPGSAQSQLLQLKGDCFHIKAIFEPDDSKVVGLCIRGQRIAYNVAEKKLDALGSARVELQNGRLMLEILVDRTTIETFANDGLAAFSSVYLAKPDELNISEICEGGSCKMSLTIYPLKSAWPAAGDASSK